MMRNCSEMFYARGGRWSFHTTKTHSRRALRPQPANVIDERLPTEMALDGLRHIP